MIRAVRQIVEITAVALLISAALTMVLARDRTSWLPTLVVMSLVSLCFASTYVGVVRLLLDRLLERVGPWWQRGLMHVAAVTMAAALGGEAAVRIVGLVGGRVHRLRVMGVGFAVIAAIRLIEVGYEHLRRQVRRVELREEQAMQQALRAELAALQARTDPHFLFNALNTVAGLIEEDPRRAVEVVTRLAGFFRHTLQSSRATRVALSDEVRAAAAYLEIQSLRFGDRLDWSMEVEPGLGSMAVPPFLLQPLVENAVLHGASGSRSRTHIRLAAGAVGNRLELTVEDDGPGPGGSTHAGAGTALDDIDERLELLYGGAARLTTSRGPSGGFLVRLELPMTPSEAAP